MQITNTLGYFSCRLQEFCFLERIHDSPVMKFIKSLLFVIFLYPEWDKSEAVDTKILKLCNSQTSCENCLEVSSLCAWCSDWSYSNSTHEKARCNDPEKLKIFGCPREKIHTVSPPSIDLLKNVNFQDMKETDRIPVQLKPQKIKVKVGPRLKVVMTLQYRPAKNYPLDLYYLMDMTWSMKDDKETLVKLGYNMSSKFSMFTSNYRLGFGTYADKPVMPFLFPGHEDNPCKSQHAVCSPVYCFRHHLKLTNDIQHFITEVNRSSVTGNLDNLEGGLDGVVQAVVCPEIGWDRNARKIILMATDGSLHFAGDGKLGGAVKRQDFKCHLNEQGEYTLSKEYDYPSLAEIFKLLKENKVNIIFAVTEDRRSEYEQISELLEEKARVATLSKDSSNILEIIEKAYHEITKKVVLRDNSSSPLRLEYFSSCGKNGPKLATSECDGIEEGQVYDFELVLSFEEYPRNQSLWKQTIVIEDALASKASETIIEVEFLHGCDCKDTESLYCKHGTNDCGLCSCDFGWSGKYCDCNERLLTENQLQCIAPNATSICSNKGECICGSCICDEGYNGQFCECSACDKIDGIECANRGVCTCGVCHCLEDWKGKACQCPSTDELCIVPGSQEVCAGHGYCDCGECRCNVTAEDGSYYRGTYCESSISTKGRDLCVLYNSCVNATFLNSQKIDQFCRMNITVYRSEIVESVDPGNEHFCLVKTTIGRETCNIPYIYEFQKDNNVILKIGKMTCPTPVHLGTIPGIIFAAILAVGLLSLLIWKCWTREKDKRECAKFELEQKKTVYSQKSNPLYKPPVTKFRVPSTYKED
ncbi:integrin beta-nu [Calliopsis andreniformis]|uniref:integrin beta-nu n=1 Tax=Calliopsis andreniformis TaxID=337506 RepID=UPI003FCD7B41